jgi:hypothetical protein
MAHSKIEILLKFSILFLFLVYIHEFASYSNSRVKCLLLIGPVNLTVIVMIADNHCTDPIIINH